MTCIFKTCNYYVQFKFSRTILIDHLNKFINCGGPLLAEWWWLKKAQIMVSTSKKFTFTIHSRIWFGGMDCCTNLAVKYKLDDHMSSCSLPNRRENVIRGPQIWDKIKTRSTTLIIFIKYPNQSRFKNMHFLASLIEKYNILLAVIGLYHYTTARLWWGLFGWNSHNNCREKINWKYKSRLDTYTPHDRQ